MGYCTPADLILYGAPAEALQGIALPTQQAACDAASARADSYLRGRYPLPLLAWGIDITMHTAWVAIYILMYARGIQPDAAQMGADPVVAQRYYEAVGYPDRPGTGWFPGVQRQAIHPDVTVAQPTAPQFQLPQVSTGTPRGWEGDNATRGARRCW